MNASELSLFVQSTKSSKVSANYSYHYTIYDSLRVWLTNLPPDNNCSLLTNALPHPQGREGNMNICNLPIWVDSSLPDMERTTFSPSTTNIHHASCLCVIVYPLLVLQSYHACFCLATPFVSYYGRTTH